MSRATTLGIALALSGLPACTTGRVIWIPDRGEAPAGAAAEQAQEVSPFSGLTELMGDEAPAVAPEPFTLELEGTAIALEMLPLTFPSGEVLWMSATEIPWEAFDVYTYGFEIPRERRVAEFDGATRPSKPYGSPDRGWGHEGFPALSLTAFSAELFCDWLGARTATSLRLPSQSEWLFAAREGAAGPPRFSLADPDRELPSDLGTAVGWAPANGPRTVELAELEPNALGFSGLLGNLGEWARIHVADETAHVLCGGHFLDADAERVPGRRETQQSTWNQTDPQNPKSRWWLSDAPFVGFRIVATSPPELP